MLRCVCVCECLQYEAAVEKEQMKDGPGELIVANFGKRVDQAVQIHRI